MTVENGEPTIIRLAQIKQWLIPADSESYKVLADVGIPLTIFHEDFLPTIKLVTDQHNIRGIGVNFKDEILDPFLSKVGTTWQKKAESATATIKSKDMVFEVSMKDPQFSKARASIDRMRDVLYDFFCRWGYCAVFDYSEVRNKAVLRVDYVHDPARQPIVGLNEKPESDSEKVQIALGGLRLTFKFDKFDQRSRKLPTKPGRDQQVEHEHGYVHTVIEIKKGGEYVPTYSTRCRYADVSNVLPVVTQLMTVLQFNPSNLEVEA